MFEHRIAHFLNILPYNQINHGSSSLVQFYKLSPAIRQLGLFNFYWLSNTSLWDIYCCRYCSRFIHSEWNLTLYFPISISAFNGLAICMFIIRWQLLPFFGCGNFWSGFKRGLQWRSVSCRKRLNAIVLLQFFFFVLWLLCCGCVVGAVLKNYLVLINLTKHFV